MAYLATQYRISILEAVNQAFGTAGDVTFLTDVANGVDVEQPFAVRALECALLLMAVLRASEFLYWMLLFADKLRLSLEFETEGGSEYLRSVDAARAYMLDASETGQVLDVLRKGRFTKIFDGQSKLLDYFSALHFIEQLISVYFRSDLGGTVLNIDAALAFGRVVGLKQLQELSNRKLALLGG